MSLEVEFRPGHIFNISGLPWGVARIIIFTLKYPHCLPDNALVLADALAEMRDEIGPGGIYFDAVSRAERDLRDTAPIFRAVPA